MEDLGSSLRTPAHPKLRKIVPHGAKLFQRNAASVSAPESAEWFTFQRNFLFWRREQHNEGWESGGKGAQKYGRQENVVREAGDSDPRVPPHWTGIAEQSMVDFYIFSSNHHLR